MRVVENRCAHRGVRFCQQPHGNARSFVCPYHQWTYKLNGDLAGLPFKDGVKEGDTVNGGMPPDFDLKSNGLTRLRVEVLHGLVFATFSDAAEPLRDYQLTPRQVREAADVFIAALPRDLILLLRHCGCGGMPVKELAEQIASAHYHGGKLGLVHKQKGDSLSAGRQIVAPAHRATLLGSWVLTLLKLRVGDALGARDMQAAQIVLDILCVAALSLHMDPVSTSPNPDERPPA